MSTGLVPLAPARVSDPRPHSLSSHIQSQVAQSGNIFPTRKNTWEGTGDAARSTDEHEVTPHHVFRGYKRSAHGTLFLHSEVFTEIHSLVSESLDPNQNPK